MYKKLFILFFIVAISGCSLSDLKTPYPEIVFYKLDQQPIDITIENKLTSTIQIRNFSINSEYETFHLVAETGEAQIKRYFYNRWISEPSTLITDYIVTRFNRSEAFHSVLAPVSFVAPDYILTGQVMEFHGYNDPEDEDDSYSAFSIKVNLIKRDISTSNESIVFSKNYSATAPRGDDDIESIAVALSKAVAKATDEAIVDIIDVVSDIESGTLTNKDQ